MSAEVCVLVARGKDVRLLKSGFEVGIVVGRFGLS